MNFSKKTIIAAAGNSPAGPAPITAWELDTAVLPNYLALNASLGGISLTTPDSLYISPDGYNLYVCQSTTIYQYTLSTPWLVSTATYTRSTTYAGNSITGIFFKEDGTRMFILDTAFNLIDFDLSTSWNISTKTEVAYFFSGLDSAPQGMFIGPDGQDLYIIGSGSDNVYQFRLSTPWRFTSSSYIRSFSVAAQETVPTAVFFTSGGSTMFIIGTSTDRIHEYSLSTAWNISTASFVRTSGTPPETAPNGLFFNPDGTTVYIVGTGLDYVYTYIMTTAWNISTLKTYNQYRVAAQDTSPNGLSFSEDGTKMYILGAAGADVNQYTLSTPWDIQTATYQKVFYIGTQESAPTALFFSTDGTNMYVMGAIGDDINQYSLSTAWDIATASYVRLYSVAGQETGPAGLYFSPDGTNMYVTGGAGDDLNQYSLLVPWNIGTASYVRVAAAGLDTAPTGIFFKSDGTRFYLYGTSSDILWAYNLSTPWNISTLSYYQQLSLRTLDSTLQDLYFKSDGTKLYVVGSGLDAVFAIDL